MGQVGGNNRSSSWMPVLISVAFGAFAIVGVVAMHFEAMKISTDGVEVTPRKNRRHPAWEHGYEAAKAGFARESCPFSDSWYSADSRERWLLGFMQAEFEMKAANVEP